ncbi:MAG: hypothetical protein ACP5D7_17615 [Limnospira sp.]
MEASKNREWSTRILRSASGETFTEHRLLQYETTDGAVFFEIKEYRNGNCTIACTQRVLSISTPLSIYDARIYCEKAMKILQFSGNYLEALQFREEFFLALSERKVRSRFLAIA